MGEGCVISLTSSSSSAEDPTVSTSGDGTPSAAWAISLSCRLLCSKLLIEQSDGDTSDSFEDQCGRRGEEAARGDPSAWSRDSKSEKLLSSEEVAL